MYILGWEDKECNRLQLCDKNLGTKRSSTSKRCQQNEKTGIVILQLELQRWLPFCTCQFDVWNTLWHRVHDLFRSFVLSVPFSIFRAGKCLCHTCVMPKLSSNSSQALLCNTYCSGSFYTLFILVYVSFTSISLHLLSSSVSLGFLEQELWMHVAEWPSLTSAL